MLQESIAYQKQCLIYSLTFTHLVSESFIQSFSDLKQLPA